MLTLYFKNKRIRDKLLVMNIMVVVSTLILLFMLMVAYQYVVYKNELIKNINSQLLIIEGNLGSAVLFEDKAAANEILASFRIDKNVDSAFIELENKTIFSEFKQQSLAKIKDSSHQKLTNDLHIVRPIVVNNQTLGHIHVYVTLAQVKYEIRFFIFILLLALVGAVIFARLVSKRIQRYIAEPIAYLEKLVTRITQGHDYSMRSNIQTDDEIGALSNGINNMLEDIQNRDLQLIKELEQREIIQKKLDQLAYFDTLTHLPNRHAFTESIHEVLSMGGKVTNRLYLLFLDLDNFKIVNDSHGHQLGDALLSRCAERLSRIFPENDKVYRIGGDEFAVILQTAQSHQEVEDVCNRITQALSRKFLINGHELNVGVSIGVVEHEENSRDTKSLIKHADAAMYWAKSAGKNTYKFYSLALEQANFFTQQLTDDLHYALEKNELELHYQPIINIDTAQMVGVEALLRWHNGRAGIIRPDIFIPIAESTGLIIPIGEWVIREAIAQLVLWHKSGHPDFFININISPRQLFDHRIVNSIKSAITDFQIDPKYINLELTESSLMEDVDKAIAILEGIQSIGVGVAIDDFGTGHSSMSYLKQFPISTIKIDKSFIKGIPTDQVDCAIIDAIFALAGSLNLDVVAEGVETEDQYAFLRTKRCTKLQGYLFSKPLPAKNIEDLLTQSNVVKRVTSLFHKT
jgi:diguanylate cyclase